MAGDLTNFFQSEACLQAIEEQQARELQAYQALHPDTSALEVKLDEANARFAAAVGIPLVQYLALSQDHNFLLAVGTAIANRNTLTDQERCDQDSQLIQGLLGF